MARSPETEAPTDPSARQYDIDAAHPLPYGGAACRLSPHGTAETAKAA